MAGRSFRICSVCCDGTAKHRVGVKRPHRCLPIAGLPGGGKLQQSVDHGLRRRVRRYAQCTANISARPQHSGLVSGDNVTQRGLLLSSPARKSTAAHALCCVYRIVSCAVLAKAERPGGVAGCANIVVECRPNAEGQLRGIGRRRGCRAGGKRQARQDRDGTNRHGTPSSPAVPDQGGHAGADRAVVKVGHPGLLTGARRMDTAYRTRVSQRTRGDRHGKAGPCTREAVAAGTDRGIGDRRGDGQAFRRRGRERGIS